MPWVFFDDQFPIHRKVTRLSDAAFRLHVSAIFWCARNLTDGVVPEEDLDDVSAQVRTPARFVPELLKRNLWHEAGESCPSEMCPAPSPDGWVIHDYLDIQPSKDKVARRRKDNAERQRRYRERHQDDTERRSRNNGVGNASRNASLTPPRSRPGPEGTRDATGSQSSSRRNARAWADDDDSIDLGIVELLTELTGQQISILDAARIRQSILAGRSVKSRGPYVARAIEDNPSKFLPAVEAVEPDLDAPSLRVVPEWCGHCDAHDRTIELADGKVARCQECNPQARNPLTSKAVS